MTCITKYLSNKQPGGLLRTVGWLRFPNFSQSVTYVTFKVSRWDSHISCITVVVLGIVSIILGILAMNQNVAFLVSLAFTIAASANLPTILYSLYWKRFNTTGAVASIYTGLISALVLIIFSPAVSGSPTAMFSNADWAWFPLSSPGIVSIPLGFLAGIIGTYLGKPDNFDELQAEMEVRSLTGVGVEAPVDH